MCGEGVTLLIWVRRPLAFSGVLPVWLLPVPGSKSRSVCKRVSAVLRSRRFLAWTRGLKFVL